MPGSSLATHQSALTLTSTKRNSLTPPSAGALKTHLPLQEQNDCKSTEDVPGRLRAMAALLSAEAQEMQILLQKSVQQPKSYSQRCRWQTLLGIAVKVNQWWVGAYPRDLSFHPQGPGHQRVTAWCERRLRVKVPCTPHR